MEIKNSVLITEKSSGYELLDSGDGEKLERFGDVVLIRPDPQVLWGKKLPLEKWTDADAVFSQLHKWKKKAGFKEEWSAQLDGLPFFLSLFPSKHVGVFPEQSSNWKWMEEKISSRISPKQSEGNRQSEAEATKVLNLFANTGGATLASARAGAEVVHLDSSKFAVDLAGKNLKNSNMADAKVRFIVDDVRKFVEREIKRKSKYDVIILDPPVYGKGSKKEVWKIEEDLLPLILRLKNLLSEKPLGVLLNGYSSVYSSQTYENLLSTVFGGLGAKTSSGELCIKESSNGRLLSAGIFAKAEF
jgi:23S rRNA (cytosine1962-C5)-methyltransferase